MTMTKMTTMMIITGKVLLAKWAYCGYCPYKFIILNKWCNGVCHQQILTKPALIKRQKYHQSPKLGIVTEGPSLWGITV